MLALWGPVLALMAAIFIASSIPDLPAAPGDVSDKTMHMIAYGLLSAFVLRALAGARWKGVTGRRALAAVMLTTVYGVTDEIHQYFVEGRHADVADVVADAIGASAAAGAIWTWGIIKKRFVR
jgi:VanZ family protein